MRLLKRLRFAWKYDFSPTFHVYSPKQMEVTYLDYKDAEAFWRQHIEYRPKVLIEVTPTNTKRGE